MPENYPKNYTVVDIETNGLSPQKHDIIELSAIRVRNNKVDKEFSSLVHTPNGVNYYIQNLTGITNDMLKNAPSIIDAMPKFIDFIGDDIILGHNINFDLRFIKAKLRENFSKELKNESMDTMTIAKKNIKLDSYKLTSVASHYGINTSNNHRGLKDCQITFEVYTNLTEPEAVQTSLI